MSTRIAGFMIASVVAATITPAVSQELGSAKQGEGLAQSVCVECHAVAPGALRSPNGKAPTFQAIARTPGMSPMALRVWLQSGPHREMPNLSLKADEVDNVIAYIEMLK